MTMTATPRTEGAPAAWVGCLGCYNSGKLIGKWMSDPDEIREYRCPEPVTVYDLHEELWVMDHENMPLIDGECNPVTFAEAIEWLDELEDWRPVEAVAAWLDNFHNTWRDADLTDFDEAYNGEWSSREDFARELADDLGAVDEDATWPNNYIDWERATRDLFMDYWDAEAPGGTIYVFRSM
jgi:antirestriction protein